MKKITNGSTIKVHYTGRLEDGNIFDTSMVEGRDPLEATLGQGMLIPGFEQGLMEMMIGDKKTIEIEPSDAYGEVYPDRYQIVPISQVPEGVKVGDVLTGDGPQGPFQVNVTEVTETEVKLDFNHPLAGKKLIFDLEVLDVQ